MVHLLLDGVTKRKVNRGLALNYALHQDPIYRKGLERLSCAKKKRLMTASYLFPVLVPLVGLIFPALAMATLFLFIEGDEVV